MKEYLEVFNALRNDWLAIEGRTQPHFRIQLMSQFLQRSTVSNRVKYLGELYRGLTKEGKEAVRWL